MPFAATWLDLEIVILSEVKLDRERQILYDIAYMWNLKKMVHGLGARPALLPPKHPPPCFCKQEGHPTGVHQWFKPGAPPEAGRGVQGSLLG